MNLALAECELPVRLRFERTMTDEELLRFCAANELLRVEREVDGELIIMSPTGTEGGRMETTVTIELGMWAHQNGGGYVLGSTTGMKLPDGSVRAADAAWVSENRWSKRTAEPRKNFALLCPEFVIEVRSESDGLAALRNKMQMWVANGAELAWLVDPKRRVVEVYRAGEAPEVHQDPTSVQGTGCVRGFELVMARIWG